MIQFEFGETNLEARTLLVPEIKRLSISVSMRRKAGVGASTASVASIAELMGAGPGVRPGISSAAAARPAPGIRERNEGAAVEDKLDTRQERREAE